MLDFLYYAPTMIYFGRNAEIDVAKAIQNENVQKVMIVYGGESVIKSGLLERVCATLDAAGIEHVRLGGVKPNPRLSKVYEGINIAKKEGVELLLAVGGGSVIDTCKAIGAGLYYGGDVWDLYTGKSLCQGSYPVGCILTIAAAGSEMSNGSVITNDQNTLKRSFNSNFCPCKFAIMNPELTYSLPPYQTSSGCVDIIMHTLERYFSHKYMALTDSIAASIIHTIMKYAKVALEKPDDYEARANIMWAGSLSHNGITGCGTRGDWATHMIEHELSGMFDVAHGAGLSAIWGSWARYVLDTNVNRFVMFAMDIMNITPDACITKREYALLGIKKMEAFFSSLNMPTSLHDLGIDATDNAIQLMAANCTNGNSHPVGSFRQLDSEDIKKILIAAK